MARIEKKDIEKRKLYLGPMSKNIVDAIINYNTNVQNIVGIVASRRQIDYFGGYVNNWRTSMFNAYVKEKNKDVIICRDHGGPLQGSSEDDGMGSLSVDSIYWDIIHIDPFKQYKLEDSINYTIRAMEDCYKSCPDCHFYEIGTEQSISYMDEETLYSFIMAIRSRLDPKIFSRIAYVVIQSGTSLEAGRNTGTYDENRLKSMIEITKEFGLLSKEHNGDFISSSQIKRKFELGLSAINIAPELANIEAKYILNNGISDSKIEQWYKLCVQNGQYKKWFPKNINPEEHKLEIIQFCGHYVFTNPEFIDIFDLDTASGYVNDEIKKFINDRV